MAITISTINGELRRNKRVGFKRIRSPFSLTLNQNLHFSIVVLKQQSSVGQGPAQMHQVQNNLGNNWNNPIVSVPSIQQQQPPAAISSIPNLSTVNVAREIENVVAQQNTLRDQIRQSEQNLSAQHGVINSFVFHGNEFDSD